MCSISKKNCFFFGFLTIHRKGVRALQEFPRFFFWVARSLHLYALYAKQDAIQITPEKFWKVMTILQLLSKILESEDDTQTTLKNSGKSWCCLTFPVIFFPFSNMRSKGIVYVNIWVSVFYVCVLRVRSIFYFFSFIFLFFSLFRHEI